MPDFEIKDGADEEEQETQEEQRQQIGEMLSEGPDEEEETSESEQEEVEQEEPSTEETSEEEESSRGEESEEQEEESSGEEKNTEQALREELNDVYAQLEELQDKVNEGSETETEEQKSSEETEESEQEFEVEDRQFVTDEEIEEFQDDPSKINDFLNRVFNEALEESMRRLPNVVTQKVNRSMTMKERAKEFYQENDDLVEYRDFVGHVANEIQSNNPDADLDTVFEKTAKEARKRLGIKKKASEREDERREEEEEQGPAFAGKPRGSRKGSGTDQRSDQQKQIDDLIG